MVKRYRLNLIVVLLLSGCLVRSTPPRYSLDSELSKGAREYIKKHGVVLLSTTNNPEISEEVRADGKVTIDTGYTDDGKNIASALVTLLSLGLLPAPFYSDYLKISYPMSDSQNGYSTLQYTYLRETVGILPILFSILPNWKILEEDGSSTRYEDGKEAFELALITTLNSIASKSKE